ncbi:hypothetical protein BY458DRAFT_515826 [Sporodiniella umbellata]|nr:hypothetical protein BY458DRAFT_515826 [Sporodiniella umbellata]
MPIARSVRTLTTNNVPTKNTITQWQPIKRVSRETMEKIRTLASSQPDVYNALTISKEYKLSVEAVRRILKSNYKPTPEAAERQERNRYKAMGERQEAFRAQEKSHGHEGLKKGFPSSPKDTKWQEKSSYKDTRDRQGGFKAFAKPREFGAKKEKLHYDSKKSSQRHMSVKRPTSPHRKDSR